MSVTYFLVRVREPVAASGLQLRGLDERTTLPFGSLDEIKTRLLRDDRFEDRSEERELVFQRAREGGFLPSMELPPGAELRFQGSTSEHEVSLQGDPVTSIAINRCAPSEFLLIIDLIPDLAPFALLSDSSEEVLDPESLRPRDPEAAESVFGEPAPARGGLGGMLVPRWQLEANLYARQGPIVTPKGLILVPTGNGVEVLDAAKGSTLWTRKLEHRGMCVTLAGDTVVLAGNHPESFGLSVQDGSMVWRQPLEGEVLSPGAMLPTGNLAMVSTRSRDKAWLTILDPSTGATLRKIELDRANMVSVATAEDWLLTAHGNLVSCFDCQTGELLGRREVPPADTGMCLFYPSMEHMCGLAGRAIILHTHGLESWRLPDLEEPETLTRFGYGPERCLGLCGDHVVAGGRLPDGGPAVLRVFAPPSFDVLHEIEILAGPAAIVDLGRGRCACLVSAPRQDPLLGANREGEAHILVLETASGRILHEEHLGSRGWYAGHLASGDGRLYVTYSLPDRRGDAFLRAYDVRQ